MPKPKAQIKSKAQSIQGPPLDFDIDLVFGF
jgi:hypothetical protein